MIHPLLVSNVRIRRSGRLDLLEKASALKQEETRESGDGVCFPTWVARCARDAIVGELVGYIGFQRDEKSR